MENSDINLIPVNSKSGNIVGAAYDEQSETVIVKFQNDTIYEYGVGDDPIPVSEWEAWAATFDDEDKSTGTMFHQTIRKYPCNKLK